ncbi:hypothetical protein [Sphingomonas aerophila]|uniref:Nucleoside-diphosphate-sugar epimerase n=1 Tax=Sphingomonas aerophila TaxID=1344948 RepID=A0A7W9EVK2_9SPHN|nr:hypothetical protein [Sphingomonas aerophila]MBB5716315.1 nucleoside-diphosphate-sugar epimerase [Sphingomonas aerophila]
MNRKGVTRIEAARPDVAPPVCEVLLIGRDGFLGDYVAEGLRRAGLVVLTLSPGEMPHPGVEGCGGAVMDIGLPTDDLLRASNWLAERNIPVVLIGGAAARLPPEWQRRPVLLQPFASFQVVEQLRLLGVPLQMTVNQAMPL